MALRPGSGQPEASSGPPSSADADADCSRPQLQGQRRFRGTGAPSVAAGLCISPGAPQRAQAGPACTCTKAQGPTVYEQKTLGARLSPWEGRYHTGGTPPLKEENSLHHPSAQDHN